jgi:formate dehydrogenase iron-sulfur subunit
MSYGILVDTTKCKACEKCVLACAEKQNVTREQAIKEKALNRDGLSAYRRTNIAMVEQGHFAKVSCMHCLEPSCVSACLVGSLKQTDKGAVIYDPDKCIGCRYCMIACPFHVPRYEWDKNTPFMVKCDMCFDRVDKGELPACVEACPEGVLKFGNRDELLKEAKATVQNNPDLYLNHVWGEEEFGGTSVMYISDIQLAGIGWPEAIPAPIPSLTEPLIHTTPFIGLTVAGTLLAINWTVRRRMKLAAENNLETQALSEKEQEDNE